MMDWPHSIDEHGTHNEMVWDELDIIIPQPIPFEYNTRDVTSSSSQRFAGDPPDDRDTKATKRRAAVAAASRATRARRKQEFVALKEKNFKLEEERETFLKMIADLQVKVQNLRESGSIDLRMENDLLRGELKQHKMFLDSFKRIADGAPTTSSAKQSMVKQGTDATLSQLLSMLATSMVDPTWHIGRVHGAPDIRMRYQFLPSNVPRNQVKRISIRLDLAVVPNAKLDHFAHIMWKMWCDEDMNMRFSKHFGCVTDCIREVDTGIDNSNTNVEAEMKEKGVFPDTAKIYYYREHQQSSSEGSDANTASKTVDTVMLLGTKRTQVAMSSYPTNERFHRFPPENIDAWKSDLSKEEPLGDSGSVYHQQNFNAIVMGSSNTQSCLEVLPAEEGVNRIRSNFLDGLTAREVPGGIAVTHVISYPTTGDSLHLPMGKEHFIDDEGYLSSTWSKAMSEMLTVLRENLEPASIDGLRVLKNMEIPIIAEFADGL